MRDVANSATGMRTMAPTRSDQGARLKNSHHRRISSAPPIAAIIALTPPSDGRSSGSM